MPSDTTSIHPSGKLNITFQELGHLYTDSFGIEYTSSTELIHSAFELFDAEKTAAAKSARTGIPAEQYIQEWDRNRDDASSAGTRLHENCERQILGRFQDMHRPADDAERLEFRAAWNEVEKIKSARFLALEPEKLIFSPRFRVAGSIDLLVKKAPKQYLIIDWKRVKEIRYSGFRNRTGTHPGTVHLQDCNFIHYSLQLSIYEQILRLEHYIEPDASVEKWLNVYRPDGTFDHIQCQHLPYESLLLMAFNATSANLEDIPF